MTVLVSFIGTGKRDVGSSETYEKTTYEFKDGRHFSSPIFIDAILRSGDFAPDKCLLIGTRTSSWAALIDTMRGDNDHDIEKLWYDIEELFEKKIDITDELLDRLSLALTGHWKKDFRCMAHSPEIREENANEIIMCYCTSINDFAGKGDDIIIDITHCFRSMPVLMMVSLQMRTDFSATANNSVSIIYGEYISSDKISHVRYLGPAWNGIKLTQSIRQFFEAFEAEGLAAAVKEFWEQGSKAIERLGNTVQSLCLTRIDQAVEQLGGAVNNVPLNYPSWFGPVLERLRKLYNKLNKDDKYLCIRALSGILADNKNYGLALIALHLSLEAFILKTLGKEEDYARYDAMYPKNGIGHWDSFYKNHCDREMKKGLNFIRNSRNMVAHGGEQSKGMEPEIPIRVEKRYRQCRMALEKLISNVVKQ